MLCQAAVDEFAMSYACMNSDCASGGCGTEADGCRNALSPMQLIAECDECGMTHATCPILNNYFWSSGAQMAVDSEMIDKFGLSDTVLHSRYDDQMKSAINSRSCSTNVADLSASVAPEDVLETDYSMMTHGCRSAWLPFDGNVEVMGLTSLGALKSGSCVYHVSEDYSDNKYRQSLTADRGSSQIIRVFELHSGEDMKTFRNLNCLPSSDSEVDVVTDDRVDKAQPKPFDSQTCVSSTSTSSASDHIADIHNYSCQRVLPSTFRYQTVVCNRESNRWTAKSGGLHIRSHYHRSERSAKKAGKHISAQRSSSTSKTVRVGKCMSEQCKVCHKADRKLRSLHNDKERDRRQELACDMNTLRKLIGLNNTRRPSKQATLQSAVHCIRRLQQEEAKLQTEYKVLSSTHNKLLALLSAHHESTG